ncbi:hypothetical protein L1887_14835 [Cichorium endivia]|nr:hypothetical protein L1887_14835 [Cichorium endivia]
MGRRRRRSICKASQVSVVRWLYWAKKVADGGEGGTQVTEEARAGGRGSRRWSKGGSETYRHCQSSGVGAAVSVDDDDQGCRRRLCPKLATKGPISGSANIEMDLNGKQKEADEAEVEQRMQEDGSSTGLKTTKLHAVPVPRQLKQQPWREQYKEHH